MNETEIVEAGESSDEPREIEMLEQIEEVEEPEAGSLLQEISISELNIVAEDAVAPEEAEDEPDNRKWYVIHCYSGYENKVKHNLEQRIESMNMQDMIFQAIVPTEEEIEVRDGKRRTVERRVFPGYVLVQMIMTDESWYVVRNTPGVTQIIDTPLRAEEMQTILKRMEDGAPKIKVTFKAGQKVRIIDGPFADFVGSVDEVNMEKGKVRVLVSFFGRETPVELDFLQIEKT